MNEPTATVISMPEEPPAPSGSSIPSRSLRKYRGGFSTSICDIFRDPHRRTDCCAVACCGVLSSDRSRYLLTGERPRPLWVRVLTYLIIPALFIAAMNYFAVEIPVEDGNGGEDSGEKGDDEQQQTQKVAPPELFWALIFYISVIVTCGFMRNRENRKMIMMKLYEERARERGEEVDLVRLNMYLSRHNLDTTRAHRCCSCCYAHDHEFYDETAGMMQRDDLGENEERDEDFCTRLWDCLSTTFWCCQCWCQFCGICAIAQEEREVNRLTGNDEPKLDYLTFQPYQEYYPAIQILRENQSKSVMGHLRAISELSSKLLKNVAAVVVILALFALSNIDSNFTWENLIVLFLTLLQYVTSIYYLPICLYIIL